MDEYEVVIKSDADDDTEGLFIGSEHDCSVFMDGYIMGLNTHSHYALVIKTIEERFAELVSPLVTEPKLTLQILKRPPEISAPV